MLFQAICPLVTSGIPIFFFIVTICFSLCPGAISAFMTTGVTCITVFNPLTTIFFMRCYREALFKRFRKAQARVTNTMTFNGLGGSATTLSAGTASR
ncbi:hypothetical protein AAVH_36131 [Aphelenchoides avenae]|nr:hypothetical protein AAVH_36131 [Aphelenchus avenae]